MILDTNILSAIVSDRPAPALQQRLAETAGPLYTTAVNWAEICYGLARHASGARLRQRCEEALLPALQILDFDTDCAEVYGRLRAHLSTRGQVLDEADLMIASIALWHGLPLVTANLRHFARVPELEVVNWMEG
jgi:tRNA(fMet)-specific endonuclease VapC